MFVSSAFLCSTGGDGDGAPDRVVPDTQLRIQVVRTAQLEDPVARVDLEFVMAIHLDNLRPAASVELYDALLRPADAFVVQNIIVVQLEEALFERFVDLAALQQPAALCRPGRRCYAE